MSVRFCSVQKSRILYDVLQEVSELERKVPSKFREFERTFLFLKIHLTISGSTLFSVIFFVTQLQKTTDVYPYYLHCTIVCDVMANCFRCPPVRHSHAFRTVRTYFSGTIWNFGGYNWIVLDDCACLQLHVILRSMFAGAYLHVCSFLFSWTNESSLFSSGMKKEPPNSFFFSMESVRLP